MIYFGVTLRSKGASKNWDNVVKLFNRTLRSIYRQTDPDFHILVACHDIPELDQEYDERLEFLTTDTPIPKDGEEMMMDKGYKLSMIGKRIRELGGGYTMIVDADDLVSNRIAKYVNSHPNQNGFLSKYGYAYNDGLPYMKRLLKLHGICGSCAIINYKVEDLPDSLPENLWDMKPVDWWIMRKSHRVIPDYMKEQGRELAEIPFPTTIYVRNNGDNWSMFVGSDLSWKRKLELLIRRKVRLDGPVGKEFGF